MRVDNSHDWQLVMAALYVALRPQRSEISMSPFSARRMRRTSPAGAPLCSDRSDVPTG